MGHAGRQFDAQIDDEAEHYSVIYRTSHHNVVFDVLRSRKGWVETTSDTDWDFNWADTGWIREFFDQMQFDDQQRVNHFRNHFELTRKDLLVKNLKRTKRQLEKSGENFKEEASKFNFFPTTYVLPQEYSLFMEEFKKSGGATWIMKPIGRAQGRGIFLFNKLSQVSDWKKGHKWKTEGPQAETYVAQRYVQRPFTIGGKKFDLRLYCLVTSYTPLVVWIHRNGFARFSNTRYSEAVGDLSNSYMHLTNHSIQKTAENYDAEQGMKWGVHDLRVFLTMHHGKEKIDRLFVGIQETIVRSLISVQKTIIQDKHSFEMYGFDVLFDEDFRPWLIEVNASPSLSKSNREDHAVKYDVINDLVDIIDIEGFRTGEETTVGGFDLVCNGSKFETMESQIGCSYPSAFMQAFLEK